uniref:F-box domain-containing protein n=1 Tax=Mycena chlorophos TaxID=658473 RepID=A0ABQ0M9W6_MYCCL|nr:predicted protein [Mycena chlorophos]
MINLLHLPTDILLEILVFHGLLVPDLSALAQTCRFFHALIEEYGWSGYLRQHPRPSQSLLRTGQNWTTKQTAQFDFLVDDAWSRTDFIARSLSESWNAKLQPRLALDSTRLVIAAGNAIHAYQFSDDATPAVAFEGLCSLGGDADNYITAIHTLPDGALFIAFHDGTCESVRIVDHHATTLIVKRSPIPSLQLNNKDFIESLSLSQNALLSLSSTGLAALSDIEGFASPTTLSLNARSWASQLRLDASSPYAAFGTSSPTPLAIHSVSPSHLSSTPSAILSLAKREIRTTAVYGIARGPPSVWGGSPSIVVSGWYNGLVAVHDLRSSTRDHSSAAAATTLLPVLTLNNSISDEPIYSVSCGGGNGSHVACGTARHGVVSIWDVRAPRDGFSVHAPFNDRSPVYSLITESSRIFGATDSRPFVFDFGPGVTEAAYPAVQAPIRPGASYIPYHRPAGFYVTKYHHRAVTSRLAIA